jgi:hypothetical protein
MKTKRGKKGKEIEMMNGWNQNKESGHCTCPTRLLEVAFVF